MMDDRRFVPRLSSFFLRLYLIRHDPGLTIRAFQILVGLIAIRKRLGFRIEFEPLVTDSIGDVGHVTEHHRMVPDLHIGGWPLSRSDTVDEIILMLLVGLPAVFGTNQFALRIIGLPAAAMPAEIHKALRPENLNLRTAKRPVGEPV